VNHRGRLKAFASQLRGILGPGSPGLPTRVVKHHGVPLIASVGRCAVSSAATREKENGED
jgi:hypothetical protein